MLTVGSFLLAVELLCLQWRLGVFLVTVGASVLTIEAFYLQWESASNESLNRTFMCCKDSRRQEFPKVNGQSL